MNNPLHQLQTATVTVNHMMSPNKGTEELELPNNPPVADGKMPQAENHPAAKPQSSDSNTPPSTDTEESIEREGYIWEQSLD